MINGGTPLGTSFDSAVAPLDFNMNASGPSTWPSAPISTFSTVVPSVDLSQTYGNYESNKNSMLSQSSSSSVLDTGNTILAATPAEKFPATLDLNSGNSSALAQAASQFNDEHILSSETIILPEVRAPLHFVGEETEQT